MKINHIRYTDLLINNKIDSVDMLEILKGFILGINIDISYCNIDRLIRIFLKKAGIDNLIIEHNFLSEIPQTYLLLTGISKRVSSFFSIYDAITEVIKLYNYEKPAIDY